MHQKIGSTCNIKMRLESYRTYHYLPYQLYKLYKVNYDCYLLDDELKLYFDKYREKQSGGIEFYTINLTCSDIEQYFNNKGIIWEEIDTNKLPTNDNIFDNTFMKN